MAGVVILLALSVFALFGQVRGTIKIRKEINRLEQQARDLQARNSELLTLSEYLDSPEYQEKVAREQLNLQSPGEVAVALPNSAEPEETTEDPQNIGNFARWRHYFFAPR